MDLPIKNIDDLRNEIYRLKLMEQEQGAAIAERFKSPSAVFSTILSLFQGPANADGTKGTGFFQQDLVGLISRFALPFTLNKTIFRNSGFIVKTLVGIVSQKASHFISEDSVVSTWDKIKSIIPDKWKSIIPGKNKTAKAESQD